MSSEADATDTSAKPDASWTYPTRHCRLCHEDVVPTVTFSPLGLPGPFRSTTITYTSPDGGRLIKPCKCKGTQRYIHEGCLAELRAKSPQENAFFKCNLCGFQYNTQRLLIHDILRSRVARILLTVFIMVLLMFVLGFVAEPIINFWLDPVETLAAQRYWDPVRDVQDDEEGSWLIQHLMKGFISVGIIGLVKTLLFVSPWHYWNLRQTGMLGGRLRTTTGRDRALDIGWVTFIIGVGSAFYFLYQQVAKFSHNTLSRFANNIIEVELQDDDDDLKVTPPANGTVPKATSSEETIDRSSVHEGATTDRAAPEERSPD